MHVTFGDDGSAASKAQPFFFPPAAAAAAGNMGDWPPLMLPLLRRRRLREEDREGVAEEEAELERLGLMRDLVEEEGRDVKQMKNSEPSAAVFFILCILISFVGKERL